MIIFSFRKTTLWLVSCFHCHQMSNWCSTLRNFWLFKVEKILKGSLDLIPSPQPSVKIQIISGKVCLKYKGKTLLVLVNKLLKTKSLLTRPSNVLPLHLKQTFPPIIWIFTEGEGDKIKSKFAYLLICHLKEPTTTGLYSCTLGRAEEISKEEKKNQAK